MRAPILAALCCLSMALPTPPVDTLRSDFTRLPETVTKPWCYYYWINDDVSKAGITKDLEAMRAAGIGTALIGNINPAGKDGKLPMLSEAWWDAMVHAVTEGARLGVDIGVFNCPGWSQSGGPWVDADKAMQHIVYAEARVKGGGKVRLSLPVPKEGFRDLHTLAFPSIPAEGRTLVGREGSVSTAPVGFDARAIFDGDTSTSVALPAGKSQVSVTISLKEGFSPKGLRVHASAAMRADVTVYGMIGGAERPLTSFVFDRSNPSLITGPIPFGPVAVSLPGLRAEALRVEFRNIKAPGKVLISELAFTEAPLLERYVEKQLGRMHPTPLPNWNSYIWEPQSDIHDRSLMVDTQRIVEVGGRYAADGSLEWEAPPGEWTILRMGMAPTGVHNHPAAPAATGYEVDKLDREKVKDHFNRFVGELRRRIPEESRSALKYVVMDSYEVGSQNWNQGYRQRFIRRYGYDPLPYLPVLSGRIVGGTAASDRFLWDLRRLVADDVADEYVGGLSASAHEAGMRLWLENYGHWGFPGEFLRYGGRSDLVSGEFWNEGTLGDIECKAASSAAHTYGKPMVSAEAFTASQYSFLRHPALLKKRGDWSFTEGVNHLVLHVYIHQPDDTRRPGTNAWFSTEFNRHNTWFGMARGWTDYLRRCQLMLQQGRYAADVCYYIGEDAPIMTGGRVPEIPKGFSYDYVNAEVLLERMTVRDGRLTLPDGMSYGLMVLPPVRTMRPEVARKLLSLVRAGARIFGPRPERSPSQQGQPLADWELSRTVDTLWGRLFSRTGMQPVGAGMVFTGDSLEPAIKACGLQPDVSLPEGCPLLWTHRSTERREIYFLTNTSAGEVACRPSFRISGPKPQLWDPMTGETRWLREYETADGRTQVPVRLEAHQSCFIVFESDPDPAIDTGYAVNFPRRMPMATLSKPWSVSFTDMADAKPAPQTLDSLRDLIESADSAVVYLAGRARYKTSFQQPATRKPGEPVYLNLGEVAVMASVRVNGQMAGISWMPPHVLRIDPFLKPGVNTLEVEVSNQWRNRMMREKRLPADRRTLYWIHDDIVPTEKLHPSGLIGPVTLETLRTE